jgi:glycosyltransferase involved in cell wall biosynthesis
MADLHSNGQTRGARRKTIIVTFFANPMFRSDGCHMRVLGMLRFLSTADFDVTFYSFRDYPTWPWSEPHIAEFRDSFPNVRLVLDRWSWLADFVRRSKNAVCSFAPQLSAGLAGMEVPRILPEWSKIKKNHPDAIYLVNYVDGMTQLNGIDPSRTIVDTHDILFRSYSLANGRPIWRSEVLRRLRREISLLDATAMVITIARNEQSLCELMLDGPKVRYVPPHMKPRNDLHGNAAIAADILFLGSANAKNVRGINSFLSTCRHWQTSPRLIIAGNVSDYVDTELIPASSVTVMGYVQDLAALYQSVRAVICPVEGTGLNIKIMEALAFGKPVFASASAIAALPPGSDACVFPLSQDSIRALLADSVKLKQASKAALDYVDSPFIRKAWSDLRDELERRL